MSPNYDAEMISAMRRVLDEVFADQRFVNQKSKSALEIAEHILWQDAIDGYRFAQPILRAFARRFVSMDARGKPRQSRAMTKKTGFRFCGAPLRAAPRRGREISYPKSSAASLTCSDASASA